MGSLRDSSNHSNSSNSNDNHNDNQSVVIVIVIVIMIIGRQDGAHAAAPRPLRADRRLGAAPFRKDFPL